MGGDHAPSAIAAGAVAAAAAFQLDIQISLVGAPGAIEQALARHGQPRPAAIAMAHRFVTDHFTGRVEQEIAAAHVAHH